MQPLPEIQPRLPLNTGQQAAIDGFLSFLFSSEKDMGIDGPGGTGKSFLMAHAIDETLPNYLDTCKIMGLQPNFDEVEILAMTNRAAEVLAEATKRPVRTLHSFLNLKVEEDFSNGKTRITKTRSWKIHERKIIFIDEISMMDAATYILLHEGTLNCKIVYVGDDKQLRPVIGSNPVYERSDLKWYTLTEQMRTNVPEIQRLHNQLRETVATGIFKPIQIIPGIIDHLNNDQMQAHLTATFKQQTVASRILGYTNRRVVNYNDYIREVRGLPPYYQEGELLVNNSAIQLPGSMLSVEAEVELIKLGDPSDMVIEPAKPELGLDAVNLTCRAAEFVTRSGQRFTDIPLPMDREHHAALIKHYQRAKNWERYFYLKRTFPDLRQRDAATVYKAQGSTYDTGFVDLGDISDCRNADQAARMLYVGLSRERYRIFLFGNLASKYGGLQF